MVDCPAQSYSCWVCLDITWYSLLLVPVETILNFNTDASLWTVCTSEQAKDSWREVEVKSQHPQKVSLISVQQNSIIPKGQLCLIAFPTYTVEQSTAPTRLLLMRSLCATFFSFTHSLLSLVRFINQKYLVRFRKL